jgi:hypothetical protein
MFPLLPVINRGDLRSAGISRFIAKPLRSYRSPSLASASFGHLLLRWLTILGYYRFDPQCFTQNLWDLPMLAWLLRRRCPTRCCLRPRGAGYRLSVSLYPFRLRSHRQDRHTPKILSSRGYWGRFRAHTLHLAGLAYLLFFFKIICFRVAD